MPRARSEALEKSVEGASCRALEPINVWTVKHGKQGWPDRQVFVAPNHHVWFEFKRRTGRLTKAQKRRIPWLESQGERVYVITSVAQAVEVALHEKARVRKCASM